MQSAAYILSGLAAGVASGALGIGGAVVATPLIRFAGLNPYLAIGSTVPAILPGSITGAWTYFRASHVDIRSAIIIGSAGSVTSFVGARATRAFDGNLLMLITAAVLFGLAIRLSKPGDDNDRTPGNGAAANRPPKSPAAGLFALGAVAGFFSGLLGVGGGSVLVPVLVKVFFYPMKMALGTSLAVIALTTGPNIAGQSQAGNIDWAVAALLALGTIPGARIGALLALASPEKSLRLFVAIALSGLAVVYAAIELAALSSR